MSESQHLPWGEWTRSASERLNHYEVASPAGDRGEFPRYAWHYLKTHAQAVLEAIRLNLRRKLAGTDCNVDVPRLPPAPHGPRPAILIPSAIRGNTERITLCRFMSLSARLENGPGAHDGLRPDTTPLQGRDQIVGGAISSA